MMESAASADYVSVTDPASNVLDPNSADLTIETWIKTSDTSAEIFSNNNANGTACTNNGYYLGIDASGYPVFYLDTNGATAGCDASITSQFKINDGNWHNIAVSVTRGTSAVIYVDGKAANSDTSVTSYSTITVTGNVYFGGSAGGLDAIADSTRFYSRALSAAEILSNYNAGNIEFQTRTGATSDPNDGSWEAWKPTTGETQLLSMDSDAVNWHSDIMASTTIATSTDTVIKAEGTGSLKIKMGMASTTANTVALWHFEETGTSTGTYLYDETANNNDATTTGTTVVDGIFGKARRFNGTSDYVEVSNENSFDFTTGGFTLGSWINLSYTNGTGKIIMAKYCDAACAELSYRFQVNGSNQLEILVSDVPGSNYILKYTTQALIPGQWYYAIATYNGGTTAAAFKLYLNGLEITNVGTGGAGTYTSMGNIAQPLRIGAAKSSGSIAYYFPGIIDEPFVSTRILSPDEIAETYRMGANRHLTRQVSSTDLSGANKLPFYVAADRTGTYLEAMIGESDYANYELASSTLALSTATVLYIKGDEIASSTSIKDSSFSGKAITANGDAKIAGGGKIGNSVYFDGAGDYLTIPDSDDWNIGGGDFAIDFWVRLTSFASENGLLMQFTDTGNFMRVFYYSDGILQYNVWSGGGNNSNVLKTTSALSLGVWTHVALVKSGTATTWYINGQSSGSKVMTYDWGNYTETLQIGRQENELSAFYYLTGYLDELRIIKGTALTPDQIRQAYEYGLRSHPITIDFGATLQTSDLISSATDYNFSLTATTSGLSATTSGLYLGDKIIIKENLGGTEYTAQGTVNAINANTGAITVPSWDSGSTFPSGNGYSPAATVFKWQREYFDLTGSLSTHRDAVTNLTLRPTNGAGGRTVYMDDFRYNTNYLTASSSSTITSSNNRYLQYRTIFTSTDTYVSPFLSALSTLYTSLAAMFPPVIGISGGGFLSF
ncbi:MAG: S-layer domain-containing protein [Parcubacteria group bacterium GW2011_GWC1_40_13]|nr:MAG: S-layer domain-containing protein [Parcubacteria group bacterium GW2011_GWC1_40_13]